MEKHFGFTPIFLTASAVLIISYGLTMWGSFLFRPSPILIVPMNVTSTPPQSQPILATTVATTSPQMEIGPTGVRLFEYIEIVNGCGPYYNGTCVNMRSGPGTEYPVVSLLRNGVVLKVADMIIREGHTWYKIGFDGGIRYPERVVGDWYVAADYVTVFYDQGERTKEAVSTSTSKFIVVDIGKETLYAYDGNTLFMQQAISTGLELTPTAIGVFTVNRKMPSSYMQGPVPGLSDQYYDLPGVPWDLYFTSDGAAIHGAYWHNKFGEPWSHGCVNLPPDQAHKLYLWADIGTPVIVRN